MITKLFEQKKNKPSIKSLTQKFNILKKQYFDEGDFDNRIKVSLKYHNDDKRDWLAGFLVTPDQIKQFLNGETINCFIYLNNTVFEENDHIDDSLIEEALLHEMIHLYQLSQEPEKYFDTKDGHDELFLTKSKKISNKCGYKIRTFVDPTTVISHKALKEYSDNLLKKSVIVLFSKIDTELNSFYSASLIPEDIINNVVSYLKSNFNDSISFIDRVYGSFDINEINKQIPLIFGRDPETIYKNSLQFNKERSKYIYFEPEFALKSELDSNLVKRLELSDKKDIY